MNSVSMVKCFALLNCVHNFFNCFEKSFRDVAVGTDQLNNSLNKNSDWQDPNGDQLILGVIGQVCNYKD